MPPTPTSPSTGASHLGRLLAVSVLLLAVVAVPVSLVPWQRAEAATAQYPDLETLPPRDLRFATATIDGASHRVLQFSNSVVNTGAGALDVVGTIDARTRSGPAEQRVYDDAGNYVPYAAGSFYWHDIHSHFHYEDWGRYELWSRADYDKWLASGRSTGQAKKVGSKTTSCIMDEEFISELPGTPYPARYTAGGCDLQPNGTLHEGLSPGWGDTYDWYRDEQWIDLDQTPLADGEYVLRSVTDPKNVLYESAGKADAARESQLDNEGVTPFTVSGGRILDATAPTGTLIINDTAARTTSAAVTVKALGRDDVSGVDSFRLSNDGLTWKSFAYTKNSTSPTSVAWNLSDPAYGGTPATGTKTVHGQFRDATGKWGSTVVDTIELTGTTPSPTPSTPPPTSGYAGAVMADGPVGYWRLGETSGSAAADTAGSHTGSYVGAALGQPSLVPTETDRSVGLNGRASVRIPDAADLRLGSPLSLEAWIRPTTLPGAGGWATVLTKSESYSLQFNGQQLELTVIQKGVRKRLKAPSGTIVAGQTYHVVGTYDGATERLYVNGNLVASGGLTGPASPTSSPLVVGSWDGAREFFNGQVDEVAVYAKALSATRVAAHRAAGTGGSTPTTSTLSVTTSGTGRGTVTSTPAGISCPPTCSAQFPSGSTVSLTATPDATSVFGGWTGGACTGTTPTCTFNVYAATSAAASFNAAQASPSPSPSASPPPSPSPSPSTSPTPAPGSAYADAVRADGPVGHWRLGELSGTVAADAARTHTGAYVNAPSLGQPGLLSGDGDRAVRFDGVNDHVRIPNAADLQLGAPLTLEAWIRPSVIPSTGGWATVITKPESYSLQFNGQQLELTVIQNGVRKRLKAPSGTVVAGQTYHVVGTYDGATEQLYVNGRLVASGGLTGPASATTGSLNIGSWNGSSEFFTGLIDEVAVYDRALSAARVQAHHAAGSAAP